MNDYTIEILYKGTEVFLVDLKSDSPENACRTAKNAVWMQKLRDGSEWHKDDIEARVYDLALGV